MEFVPLQEQGDVKEHNGSHNSIAFSELQAPSKIKTEA